MLTIEYINELCTRNNNSQIRNYVMVSQGVQDYAPYMLLEPLHTYPPPPHTHKKVGKIIGQKWRELTDEEKQPFNDEYEADKARYNEQLKVYRNSPAFKRWQEAKQQGTCI